MVNAVMKHAIKVNEILAIYKKNSKTEIQTQSDTIVVSKVFQSVIEELCLLYGGSLNGKLAAFRHILHVKQKPCIYLSNDIILIPITSLKAPDCILINYKHVIACKSDAQQCQIIFDNGQKIWVNCDARTMKKQMKRCDLFQEHLLYQETLNNYYLLSEREPKANEISNIKI